MVHIQLKGVFSEFGDVLPDIASLVFYVVKSVGHLQETFSKLYNFLFDTC